MSQLAGLSAPGTPGRNDAIAAFDIALRRLEADTTLSRADRMQALIAQVVQTAACNRFHTIDQQLCRRLLLGLDRSSSDELAMTQEGVAGLLGVRREGVTAAAIKLQRAGVIRYSRGHIEVLDRAGLEQRSCECYAVARKEHRRLLAVPLAVPLPARMPLPLAVPPVVRMPLPLPLSLAA